MFNFIQRISNLQEFQFILEACAGGQVTQESISKTSKYRLPSCKMLKIEVRLKK